MLVVSCFVKRGIHFVTKNITHPFAYVITRFIIKFSYNAHSDWLKQRALSENKARVDNGKLAFEFVIRNFDKFDPN